MTMDTKTAFVSFVAGAILMLGATQAWPDKMRYGDLAVATDEPSDTSKDVVEVVPEKDTPREALQVKATRTDGETVFIGSYDYLKFTINAYDEQLASLQARRDYFADLLNKAGTKFDEAEVPPEGTVFATSSKKSK